MDDHTASSFLAQTARSERLYMTCALALAILLALAGAGLVILGAGDHFDVVVRSDGRLASRLINAGPGAVAWVVSALIFWLARPPRTEWRGPAPAQSLPGDIERRELETEWALGAFSARLRDASERQIQIGGDAIARITRTAEGRLYQLCDELETHLRREAQDLREQGDARAPGRTAAFDKEVDDGLGFGSALYRVERDESGYFNPDLET